MKEYRVVIISSVYEFEINIQGNLDDPFKFNNFEDAQQRISTEKSKNNAWKNFPFAIMEKGEESSSHKWKFVYIEYPDYHLTDNRKL